MVYNTDVILLIFTTDGCLYELAALRSVSTLSVCLSVCESVYNVDRLTCRLHSFSNYSDNKGSKNNVADYAKSTAFKIA